LILVWPDWGSNWPQSTTLDRTDHNLPHSSGTDHNLPHSIELTTIYHTRVEVFHNLPHSSGSVLQSTTLEWKCSTIYHTRVEVFYNLPHSRGSTLNITPWMWF
jgi:hypothetical protein